MNFDEFVKTLDVDYWCSGVAGISFEKVVELLKTDDVFVVDVRTAAESEWVSYNYATNIPLNELPDRLDELPKDKVIAVFCYSGTRATIASTYLHAKGFDNAKILGPGVADLAAQVKPGFAKKNPLK